MSKNQIRWKNVSESDVKHDFQAFLNLYNFDVVNKQISLSLSSIQPLGIKTEAKDTSEIKKTNYTQLRDEIIFYSKSKNDDVKELIRHFKNLVSHPKNIKKATINSAKYYRLYDYRFSPIKKDSMKGVVSVDNWRLFKKKLINLIKKTN